jgi:two-component system nitrogen regulation response regulator GlnG
MVQTQQFRKDLYYRLNEFSMTIPPLRERLEDIVFLATRFLESAKADLGKDVQGLSQDAVELLLTYDWPGNVRELRNLIRRAALRCGTHITAEHLAIGPGTGKALSAPGGQGAGPESAAFRSSFKQAIQRAVAQVEKQIITQALAQTRGNKAEAARLLKVDYKTMHVKVKKYEISQPLRGESYGQT